MTYQTPTDRAYFDEKTQTEFRAQGVMDAWYIQYGFEIVNRDGNKKRDLVLARDGKQIRIEEKYREKDYGDLLIELVQDLVSNNPGWLYAESMDRLCYVILDGYRPKTIYWIDWIKFKDWLFTYLSINKIQKAIISPAGYGLTLNLSIAWDKIPGDLCKKFEL